jgi:hypothetical protein
MAPAVVAVERQQLVQVALELVVKAAIGVAAVQIVTQQVFRSLSFSTLLVRLRLVMVLR